MSPTPPSPPAEERLDAAFLRRWPLPDDTADDKKARGTVLIVGGSTATPGAIVLAGIAALRAGGGRLQLATDAEVVASLAVAVPEASVVPYGGERFEQQLADADAVVLGPGLVDRGRVTELVASVLDHVPPAMPIVVDALALGPWCEGTKGSRRHVVLTPNREELSELAGGGDDDDAPDRAVATDRGVTVACFGRVALPDGRLLVDPSSPPGLGTSGSGDVLAGIIGGLAARTGDGGQAAAWGLFVHGAAAHRLGQRIAPSGYLARELADEVAPAIAEIGRPVER